MELERKNMTTAAELRLIAGRFRLPGPVAAISVLGSGNVNDTYLLNLEGDGGRFVLQRLNPRVFPQPVLIMENLRAIADHVAGRLGGQMSGPRWEMPAIMRTAEGRDFVLDQQGACWRALSFIDDAFCPDQVTTEALARQAGEALGRFHWLLSDLDPVLLHVTLPGFHLTPGYLISYDAVKDAEPDPRYAAQVRYCKSFIEARRSTAAVLEEGRAAGRLTMRAIHGDPKIENIMIERHSGLAIALIDLDTVQPGLIHYDLGDCLRSCCNRLGEETAEIDQVCFDIGLCRAILAGYFSKAGAFLNEADYEFIYDAARLIAFELGLRFFTDFLAGDNYFKTNRPGHNLSRALVQFALTQSIEDQEEALRQMVVRCRLRLAEGMEG